ncbi:MAG TPA: cache domain-containing protein [Geminicoccaceae bacterium]|nr:cache domain-containing protein [Geminicoccaceae bacterium]
MALGAVLAGLLAASGEGLAAGEGGTAEQAKAMLERAVAAIEADEAAALAAITAGSDGFRERDLYVACSSAADGTVTAHGADAAMVGQSIYDLTDAAGKRFGEEIDAVAVEGELNVVTYLWPRPGETEAVQKETYVTKAGGQVCVVGYYP